jgi:hypothetical protein
MRIELVAFTLFVGAVVVAACGESRDTEDSQTHWLDECQRDGDCGGGLSCECGRCVESCESGTSCDVRGRTTKCFASTHAATETICGAAASSGLCLEPCTAGNCPADQLCQDGACVPKSESGGAGSPSTGGASSSGGANSGGAGTTGGAAGGAGGSSDQTGGAVGDPCAAIPQCELACPEPRVNPTDQNGCVHTCECVLPPDGLSLYYTCGDPVCRGHVPGDSLSNCTSEMPGDTCAAEGPVCDPVDDCNRVLTCAESDPTAAPGGCPISRRKYKRDIHYLDDAELARYREELVQMRLATWRYRHNAEHEHLGFIIDDNENSVAVDASGEIVDLYGYTSLAVATIQLQARQIERLERDVAELKKRLE